MRYAGFIAFVVFALTSARQARGCEIEIYPATAPSAKRIALRGVVREVVIVQGVDEIGGPAPALVVEPLPEDAAIIGKATVEVVPLDYGADCQPNAVEKRRLAEEFPPGAPVVVLGIRVEGTRASRVTCLAKYGDSVRRRGSDIRFACNDMLDFRFAGELTRSGRLLIPAHPDAAEMADFAYYRSLVELHASTDRGRKLCLLRNMAWYFVDWNNSGRALSRYDELLTRASMSAADRTVLLDEFKALLPVR